MNEMFDKIAAANASLKEDNFKDGKGVVQIRELIYKSFFNGPTFVARCQVVSSQSKGDVDPVSKQPVTPNSPGAKVGWPQLIQKHASAAGNVKGFVLALLGYKESEVTSEQFKEALARLVSTEQPARGMLIAYETYQQETRSGKNIGKINTYVRWSHVPKTEGNAPEKVAERKAEMNKTDPIL